MLNVCAILSKLNKHNDAILYARRAVTILEKRVRKLQEVEYDENIKEMNEDQEEERVNS